MKKKFIFYLSIIVLMVSCYPGGTEYYEDTDVVYTDYEKEFDFQSTTAGTYSIPDKIVKITGELADGEDPEYVKEPYNTQMLTLMKSNMAALGWKINPSDDPSDADLVLFAAVWTNTTIYYWYDYWCWYYPYYCGYGWGYPSVSTQTTGTLVMFLIADGEDYIDPTRVWTSGISGLLSGAYSTARVTKGIDQAFTQSPYLKIN